MLRLLVYSAFIALLSGCKNESANDENGQDEKMFVLLPATYTNVNFKNQLTEGVNTNILMYEYFYNGGGVAVGDVNDDGLDDIYFSGNMTTNQLYLNKGDMQFTEVTEMAGVTGREGPWKTGVTMVDVNGDSRLDIYQSYSGKINGKKRVNQLFINYGTDTAGIPRFKEEAQLYGLADSSFTTQTVFFDYDKDDDLDALLINHNPFRIENLNDSLIAQLQKKRHPSIGIKLLQNNANYFTDVTQREGLISTALSYGLGAGVADVNGDGYTDLYISHDYDVPDYLYINNGKGFNDKLKESLGHTSHFSMGNDIADINNDGLPEIYTLDMLPADNKRQKLLFAPDNYASFDLRVRAGFHAQYMRNMLHLNNGNGTFSEIGQLAGISNTDWSWAPLFADYDNDGWKDLLVTNGFVRDYTNLDFAKYAGDHLQKKKEVFRKDLLELVHQMPSSQVINYLFKNKGDLTFADVTSSWGFTVPSNSNGAAYADLDNDGDLDVVINNINVNAFIYRNQANQQLNHHYLNIKLVGTGANTHGLGAKVTLYRKGMQQYLEQMPTRGYQSSVSPVMHFGLGTESLIDSLKIEWPNGKQQLLREIKSDELRVIKATDAISSDHLMQKKSPVFRQIQSPFPFVDIKEQVNDFKRQPLFVNPQSFSGPCLVKGDINDDGLEDVFVGGGTGQPASLFVQQKNNRFQKKEIPAFTADRNSEDTDAVFLDVNRDGHTDLYVCSGGYHHFALDDSLLQDRLYLNDGKGNLVKDALALPEMKTSTSCVRVSDINADGYPDLFVGGRVVPGRYPETPSSYILINDGKGHYEDRTLTIAQSIRHVGMVTDATWIDLNNDQREDLILVGEWMPVTVMINVKGKLSDKTSSYFSESYNGWWNKIITGDFNKDGRTDLIVGNLGLNSQCKSGSQQPVDLYYNDFDQNGSVDPLLCFFIGGKSYPYISRDELLEQLGSMRKRFPNYKSYSEATLNEILNEEELRNAHHLKADILTTSYFQGDTHGYFHLKSLPVQAQYAPVFSLNLMDYNGDGNVDVLLCGNSAQARLRFGKYDANYGVLLKGSNSGEFSYVTQQQSGFHLSGDIRSVIQVNNTWLFAVNQQTMLAYRK